MDTTSLWKATSKTISFPPLSGDLDADVVIIGGGITGITAARHLSRAGLSVVVLEAGEVGSGTTGYSTGNLYATLDSLLFRVRERWDSKTAVDVVRARGETLAAIEALISEHGISCAYSRRPLYLFSVDDSSDSSLKQEHAALMEAGLTAHLVNSIPLPVPMRQAIRLEDQAQFHPLAYVSQLARRIASDRCRIYEHSAVIDLDRDEASCATDRGRVRARALIFATHTPKGFNLLQTELGPYREYGLAARLEQGSYPEGIFWSLDEAGHSIRSFEQEGANYLLVIGEKHKTGQNEKGIDYFKRLELYVRSHFDVAAILHRWSAQHYRPADELPYIGRAAASDKTYVATGFGTDGLIYGSLAARIIADDILGKENPWKELFNARRFTPAKSAASFVQENANVAVQYVKTLLARADMDDLGELQPGEGAVTEIKGHKLAASRDEAGTLTVLSRICTHLGCAVHWNGLEKSWDCPCHGSRFRPDGEVIEGPAMKHLEKKEAI
jgi:glycine/D-amino acid oxidase-like deaminating enzyme/nitrite reductase/ring-hydroxylating ferredoxin subunit